jgi:chromate transporter
LPAFLIMFALSAAYAAYGALPSMRDAFYGIGPVVLGIFAAAVYRLGRTTVKELSQAIIAATTALVILASPLGVAVTLLAAGCVGVALFDSRRKGLIALVGVAGAYAIFQSFDWFALSAVQGGAATAPGAWDLTTFFFKVGALTFGGGLSMLAFMEEQVVNQLAWLTPQEFVDGLALGQLTPGPVLMLAAFVGFRLMGFKGAAVAAAAIFLPSFLMMLSILPLLKKLGDLRLLKAFMRGAGPAVIGALAASLGQMAPHAAPDAFAVILLSATNAIILLWNVGPLPLLASGALAGAISRHATLIS